MNIDDTLSQIYEVTHIDETSMEINEKHVNIDEQIHEHRWKLMNIDDTL